MSSRVFQSVIVQMKEATDRMIGVIDADANVISCSDTSMIGEKWPEAVIRLNSAPDARQQGLSGDISAARGRRRIDARISPAGTDKRTGYCGGRRASAEYPVILTEEKTCIF